MDAARRTTGARAEPNGFAASLATIYRLMQPSRRRQLWLVLALTLVGGIAELCTIGAVVPFLSLLASPGSLAGTGLASLFAQAGAVSRADQLLMATGLFIAAALLSGAVRLSLAWTSQAFVHRLGHDITVEIQRRILLQPYSYHLEHNSSEVVALLEQVQQLTYGVIQQLIQAAGATLIALFIFVGIAAIDPLVAIAASLIFAAFYAATVILFRSRLHARSAVIASAYTERVKVVQESIGGIRDVILDQAQAAHLETLRAVDDRLTEARLAALRAGSAPRHVIETIGMIVLAVLALVVSRGAGGLTAALPVIGALALAAQRLLPLAHLTYQGWSMTAANRGVAAQIAAMLRLPVATEGPASGPFTLTNSICFSGVSLTYPGRDKPALEAIDVTLPQGSRTALTGPTGSGKSSFADLLMGLLAPTSGEVRIDDAVLTPANSAAWQRSIAHVPQSIFLLDASIARNIALSAADEPLDQERLARAVELASLADFVAQLPDGVDTIVGERGVRLSGGQRQRLGIARALYKQAPVLVLDEGTSALDDETERDIVAALHQVPGLTVLIIAHRRSTIEHCDRILRLRHGRLIGA